MGTLWTGVLASLLVTAACEGGGGEKKKPSTGTPPPAAPATAPAADDSAAPRTIEAAPPPRLHDQPVERRLHSDRIEASSFLWTDWNKFQENYHPSYILDGDPATAWVEGADSSGAGEWVRIHLSPVEGATRIRLRIQNGYQKSKALFGKNARLARVEVVALPGKASHAAQLKDAMGWQEISFEQPAGKLEAIELRVAEVFEGSKYTDLCVSDLEVYVTGLTVENPAFEKAKLDRLLAWKQQRLAAAAILGGAAAGGLPILPGYRVVAGDPLSYQAPDDGKPYAGLRAALAATAAHGAPAPMAERASKALAGGFADWLRVQLVVRQPLELPAVDGLHPARNEELVYGGPEDALLLPVTDKTVLLRSQRLTTFDTRGGNPMDDTDCKEGESAFMRPPRKSESGPLVQELLHIRCVTEETREGQATYMTWQLLEFDDEGNLALVAGPHEMVTWFEWKPGDKGAVLSGGGRIRHEGARLDRLVDARVVASH